MAVDLSAKKSNYVSGLVGHVSSLLDAIDDLISDRTAYDALGMAPGSGSAYEISQDDLAGSNAHLTPQEIADAHSSLTTLKALLVQGHLTNLNKLRR